MSTGLECEFVRIETGEWFYLLENWTSPKGAFDWRDDATAYGPFETQEEADQHLRDTQPNPGGSYTNPNADTREDETLARLIRVCREENARREKRERARDPWTYLY